MKASLRKPMSRDEFLAWEPRQELRHEFDEYRDIPSVSRYGMLGQIQQAATVFEQLGDDWIGRVLEGPAVLLMPEIGIELPLPEIYEGVQFPDTLDDD